MQELDHSDLIFKFQDCKKYLYQSLRHNTFHFNSIQSFNDPFELLFNIKQLAYNDEGIKRFYKDDFPFTALKNIKPNKHQAIIDSRLINRRSIELYFPIDVKASLYSFIEDFFGVTSFSSNYKELLMWAHYASSGKGVCLAFDRDLFDTNEDGYPKIVDVTYHEKIPKVDVEVKKMFQYNIHKIIGRKLINWKYEEEVRAYIYFAKITPFIQTSRELINRNNGLLRNVLYKPEALKGIIFGHQCTKRSMNHVKKEIRENTNFKFENIKFYKAEMDKWLGKYRFKKL